MSAPDPDDLQKLFELSVDVLCVSASDSRIQSFNPAFLSNFGYTAQEIVGRPFLSFVHPDDLEQTLVEVAGLSRGVTSLLFENRCVTASGEARWYQWSARTDASTGRIYASGRDVTNQHLDAERLQRYADLLERTQTELREAVDELTRVANTDQLTGMLNRRAFEARLAEEVNRAQRNDDALGIAMFDVDHFKRINDQHGHPMGDIVLREVARRIEAGRRQYDVIARWGGEEFIALFPGSSLEDAKAAAERILLSVAARPIVIGSVPITVRISGGVASSAGAEIDIVSDFIATADRALMLAKTNGRDRVEVAEEPYLRRAS